MASIPYTDPEEEKKKRLAAEQRKLAEAAAANASKTEADSSGNPLKDAAMAGGEEIALGSALLGAGKVTGINALKTLGTAGIRYSPHTTAAVGGYGVGKKLDEKFDISGMMGDFYGPMLAKLQGANTNTGAITPEERLAIDSGRNPAVEQKGNIVQGPITPSERQAIDGGFNPNKPIDNPMGLSTITGKYRAGEDDSPIAYEPMAQRSQGDLAAAATENYAAQFEGAAQNKDGGYTGYVVGGGKQSMSQDQYASYANEQRMGLANANAVPMGDYTPVAGTDGFVQQPLSYNSQAPQAPQAPQITNQMEASSNFKDAREAGTITPEKVIAAQEYAASMGRTFDEKMGYSKDFDQSILDKYNAERSAGQQGGQQGGRGMQTDAQGRMRSPEDDAGLSSYAKESAARETRMSESADFGSAQMRSSDGKMVTATKENRAQRDIVTGLTQEAREAGYTPQQTRTYVADKLKERQQADEDRATQKEMDELNMTKGQVELQSKISEMMPKPDEMSREDYFGFVKGLDSMGISVDPQTGNLTSVEEKFMRPNGEINLGPDSDLFQKISQMEGGKSFLAAPKDVKEFAGNQPAGARVRATDGTQRVWEVQEGGDLVQVL